MIEKNLGNLGRSIRVLLGLFLSVWTLTQPEINGIEIFILAAAVALILNGAFSRYYLWYVFDIHTCKTVAGIVQNRHNAYSSSLKTTFRVPASVVTIK